MVAAPTEDVSEEMSPDDVRAEFQHLVELLHERGDDVSPFQALLTPQNRLAVIEGLLGASEPRTVSQIADNTGVDPTSLYDHLEFLVDAGIVIQPGKAGNARTYALRDAHPFVQLLTMADVVLRHGTTPQLLEDQFVGEPDADE